MTRTPYPKKTAGPTCQHTSLYMLLWFSFCLLFPPPLPANARACCPADNVGSVLLTVTLAGAPLAQKSALHHESNLEMRETGTSYVVKWMDIPLSFLQVQDFLLSTYLVKQKPTWYGRLQFKNPLSASNSLLWTMDRQVLPTDRPTNCVSQWVWLRADGGARQERWIGRTNLLWLLGYIQVNLLCPSWFSFYARYMGLILNYLLCEPHSCYPSNTPSCLNPCSFRKHFFFFSLNNLTRSFSLACKGRKSISFRTSCTRVSTNLHCYSRLCILHQSTHDNGFACLKYASWPESPAFSITDLWLKTCNPLFFAPVSLVSSSVARITSLKKVTCLDLSLQSISS